MALCTSTRKVASHAIDKIGEKISSLHREPSDKNREAFFFLFPSKCVDLHANPLKHQQIIVSALAVLCFVYINLSGTQMQNQFAERSVRLTLFRAVM